MIEIIEEVKQLGLVLAGSGKVSALKQFLRNRPIDAQAIQRGIERGLTRCGVYDDDVQWMAASVCAAVLDELKNQE